jgi:phage terminase large subunit-like protein
MLGNVVGHYDAKENVYPRKERLENKLDGAIALIMALGRHMVAEDMTDLEYFLARATKCHEHLVVGCWRNQVP